MVRYNVCGIVALTCEGRNVVRYVLGIYVVENAKLCVLLIFHCHVRAENEAKKSKENCFYSVHIIFLLTGNKCFHFVYNNTDYQGTF